MLITRSVKCSMATCFRTFSKLPFTRLALFSNHSVEIHLISHFLSARRGKRACAQPRYLWGRDGGGNRDATNVLVFLSSVVNPISVCHPAAEQVRVEGEWDSCYPGTWLLMPFCRTPSSLSGWQWLFRCNFTVVFNSLLRFLLKESTNDDWRNDTYCTALRTAIHASAGHKTINDDDVTRGLKYSQRDWQSATCRCPFRHEMWLGR